MTAELPVVSVSEDGGFTVRQGFLGGPYRTDFPQRAIDRVAAIMTDLRDLYGNEACWPWPRSIRRDGYAQISVSIGGNRTRSIQVHRIAWVAAGRHLPDDLTVDHQCLNPACCNPAHLRLLPFSENVSGNRTATGLRARTHCQEGHEFTPENTYRRPDGGRECRTCKRQRRAIS